MRSALLLILVLTLSACGMNRAVSVLPSTLDDLAEEREHVAEGR